MTRKPEMEPCGPGGGVAEDRATLPRPPQQPSDARTEPNSREQSLSEWDGAEISAEGPIGLFTGVTDSAPASRVPTGWRARGSSARQPRPPKVGASLKGRYRLEECIGDGGMGIVFRATDLEAIRLGRTSSKVAIKVLRPELRDYDAALFDEVEKSRTMQQENIVDVYGYEPDEEGGFMIMEYLSGEPLDRYVSNSYSDGMPYALALPYIKGMGAALTYAHKRGVIHSDFKPSNVFIVAASVKVLDFGIARVARSGADTTTQGDKPLGLTPAFASCEMLEFLPADKRDDVYCFALVVYFLLSGRHPFGGRRATDARSQNLPVGPLKCLTKRQNAALRRALAFNRQDRTASIEELVNEICEVASLPGRAALWTVLGGSALIAGGLALYIYERQYARQDSDQQFVLNLCKDSTNMGAISPDEKATVTALLEQGNSYLKAGRNPFDPGVLSENVSSALGAFQAVLSLGSPEDCAAAAQGVLKVADAYKSEARRLYESRDYHRAEQMTRIALRIWTDSVDMQNLLYRIMSQVPAQTAEQP